MGHATQIKIGDRVRSFDFAIGEFGRELLGEANSERAAYVEGTVVSIGPPFRQGAWRVGGAEVDSYGRGADWPLGSMGTGARFGILICNESIYASHARRFRLLGADFFLNLTKKDALKNHDRLG